MGIGIEVLARNLRKKARLIDSSGKAFEEVIMHISRHNVPHYGLVFFSENEDKPRGSNRSLRYILLDPEAISLREGVKFDILIRSDTAYKENTLPSNVTDRGIIPALLESYGFKPR